MGNGVGKLCLCSSGPRTISRRYDNTAFFSNNQYDKALGNSICYVRPDPYRFLSCSNVFSHDDSTQMTFRSISGASVSANSSTPPSTSLTDSSQHSSAFDSTASFESSTSFTSMPLQPAPRGSSVGSSRAGLGKRGSYSGPILGGYVSSPFDRGSNSSSIEKGSGSGSVKLQRSFSHNGYGFENRPRKRSLKKIFQKAISSTISRGQRSIVTPIKRVVSLRGFISEKKNQNANATVSSSTNFSGDLSIEEDNYQEDGDDGDGGGGDNLMESQNLHWAQGRAGEDRVHIVISKDRGWVFVGIYDGFNGPDATDYLLNNLFHTVLNELKEPLCNGKLSESTVTSVMAKSSSFIDLEEKLLCSVDRCSSTFNKENYPTGNEKLDLDSDSRRTEEKKEKSAEAVSHSEVLRGLSEALRKTEDEFLKAADETITKNPVLAMMGSCVLVMLMKGDDVYLMNVGDSRAVLAQTAEFEVLKNHNELNGNQLDDRFSYLKSLQITMDHSTHIKEEVERIRSEHPDDPCAIIKGRVKGYLNVTRAFGAGFLKQAKHNNAVLESFRVNFIGNSPYVTCSPSLHHHKLSPSDRFLILSSDGLYQYFTSEEAVAKVDSFLTSFPDTDPAHLLIQQLLSRAAQKAGIEFRELVGIPQGERRLYHDDISIVIISFEGKIWRSSL